MGFAACNEWIVAEKAAPIVRELGFNREKGPSVQADVIVIGAGLAGHCAALEAADAGADVLVLEKQATVGGSTMLSGGSFAFAGTDLQRAVGIEDSSEVLFRDMREVGANQNDPALVRLYADRQLDTFSWLRDRGVIFGPIQISSGQSVPRLHPTDPRQVIRVLHDHLVRSNRIRLLSRAGVRRLLREHDGAAVSGVIASVDDEDVAVEARAGVVLASGGFSRNPKMIESFVPEQAAAKRVGGAGNVGDGLRLAWRLGADFRDVGYVKGTFGNHPEGGPEQHTAMLAVYKGAIAVNRLGKRFTNEALSYKTLGDACLAQPGHIAFQIFDQKIMDAAVEGVTIFDFKRRLAEGLLLTAPSLGELAQRIEVPERALFETVETYNAALASGGDREFGRAGLSLMYGDLPSIDRAPFYAYPSTSAIVATYCGLTIDTRTRVLDVERTPIEHLFAAGEVTGGFHGKAYMTGTSLGKASICGRIAGREATGRSIPARC